MYFYLYSYEHTLLHCYLANFGSFAYIFPYLVFTLPYLSVTVSFGLHKSVFFQKTNSLDIHYKWIENPHSRHFDEDRCVNNLYQRRLFMASWQRKWDNVRFYFSGHSLLGCILVSSLVLLICGTQDVLVSVQKAEAAFKNMMSYWGCLCVVISKSILIILTYVMV